MASNDYNVYQTNNGWAIKGQNNSRVSGYMDTQAQAYDRARKIVANNGGGDISIHGRNGQIREKNTIPNGNDPRNIKG
ncbi:hypothetical protein C1H84_16980 [Glutamicibacter soli]|uniref:DUF2188 domain-containing protein n=1 Tax=Glutamicibacter soli TaxID=453836 RepID=A0A365YAC8_9MICC|nr:DUF2188 domain-containing protein [Glutamicibacter soli]RBL98943.1 hypothetical protein C1H84_16980 [Glutamicibacter soli]